MGQLLGEFGGGLEGGNFWMDHGAAFERIWGRIGGGELWMDHGDNFWMDRGTVFWGDHL